jgi:hypothetical protein
VTESVCKQSQRFCFYKKQRQIAIGLEDEAVRRAWTAISRGVWHIAQLIEL